MKEVFVPVKGYEGKYEISNLRRVKTLRRGVLRSDGIRRWVNERIIYSDKISMCLGQRLTKSGKKTPNTVNPLQIMVSSFYRDYSPKTHMIVTRPGKKVPTLYDLMVLKKLEYNKVSVSNGKEVKTYKNIQTFLKDHNISLDIDFIRHLFKGWFKDMKLNKFDGWTFAFESPLRYKKEYRLIFTIFDIRDNKIKSKYA